MQFLPKPGRFRNWSEVLLDPDFSVMAWVVSNCPYWGQRPHTEAIIPRCVEGCVFWKRSKGLYCALGTPLIPFYCVFESQGCVFWKHSKGLYCALGTPLIPFYCVFELNIISNKWLKIFNWRQKPQMFCLGNYTDIYESGHTLLSWLILT